MPTIADVKFERALRRLRDGQMIYDTNQGWKFGGNKYVPQHVAAKLPIEYLYTDTRGWRVYRLNPNWRDD